MARKALISAAMTLVALSSAIAAEAAVPSASTDGTSNVTQTSALLKGTLNPNGEATTYRFEYGPTKAYGSLTPPQGPTAAAKGNIAVSAGVGSLAPNTAYHYRLVATNASGTKAGGDKTFKTLKQAPAVTLGSSAARITFGRQVVLAGQFTPAPGGKVAGVKVTLQQDTTPGTTQDFRNTATATTDATGHFSFTQSPLSNTSYRVVTATSPKATSASTAVAVALKVTLSLSTAHPRSGKSVVFSGTVAPQRTGQLVRIQKRVGTRWRTVKTGVLGQVAGASLSSYRVKVRVRKRGRFRAYVAGDASNVAGWSRSRLISPR